MFGNLRNAGIALFDSKASDMEDAVETLNSTELRAQQSMIEHFRVQGLALVCGLIEAVTNGGLEDGELPSDALDRMMAEAIDSEEADDIEWDALAGAVSDAFETLGVDESVINEMFGDNIEAADAAIEAGCETALANMPDDGEPMDDFIHDFVYGHDEADDGDDDEAEFDSAHKFVTKKFHINKASNHTKHGHTNKKTVKAHVGQFKVRRTASGQMIAYRGVLAIRHGKKVVINKRIGNQKIRISSAMRKHLNLIRSKSHTEGALKMRKRSWKKGIRMGIYQKRGG